MLKQKFRNFFFVKGAAVKSLYLMVMFFFCVVEKKERARGVKRGPFYCLQKG